MTVHTLRLILGLFFLLASVLLFTRHWVAPEWAARYDPVRMNLGAGFALVFGLLNIARWYVAWSRRRMLAVPIRTPLQPDPSLVRPEFRPEFDFVRPRDAEQDQPSPGAGREEPGAASPGR